MPTLPTDRSPTDVADTPTEHANDHNTLHAEYNVPTHTHSGAYAATSESLKIIRGRVLTDGGFVAQIVAGSGFTVLRTSTGTFTVTYTVPFTGVAPSVFVTNEYASGTYDMVTVTSGALGSCVITTQVGGTTVDAPFSFMAVGTP